MSEPKAFARDALTAAYYDQRAAEYDEWYLGQGRFAAHHRQGWDRERDAVIDLVRTLPPALWTSHAAAAS